MIDKIKKIQTNEKFRKYTKILILVLGVAYLCWFGFLQKCYIGYNSDGTVDRSTIYKAVGVILLTLVLMSSMYIKNGLSDKQNKIISWLALVLSPFIIYLTIEVFYRKIFYVYIEGLPRFYVLLNIIIMTVIIFTFLVFTNRIKATLIIVVLIAGCITAANYYVYNFRGVAIVASDVFSSETAASVAKDYKLFYDGNINFLLFINVFYIACIGKLRSFKAITRWKHRLPVFAVYLVGMGIFLNVFIFSKQLSEWKITSTLYRPHEAYRRYGSVVSMVKTIGDIMVDKPEGYSVEEIKKIASQYSETEGTGQTPNIIVIMDEAFSDPLSIGNIPISEDYMPFIRSLSENTIKGNAYVSVFGGNTANTEFEFLTGNSVGLLPVNTIPYQLFIKDKFPSIVYSLENQGYVGNLGLHPYLPNGFNRAHVYPLLGFEKFISIEDFDTSRKLRGKVTDEADFDRIIEEYEKSKSQSDSPFFLFNVTMQNHGGYGSNDPNFQQKIQIQDEAYFNEYAQNYLSLVKYTDEAVEKLVNYFKQVDEPTVIIFFGDHRPSLKQSWYEMLYGKSEEDMTQEELMKKYEIPFFAWANYDIPEEHVDKISMNYLSAYIMDQLGLKLTKFQQFELKMREQIPAMNILGYWGEDGEFYTYEDKTSPYYNLMNEYRKIQYNNMHDRGDRVDSMFYLQ
jgi:glucan phosphoethanolaminetransferase (alkaline phosphatase superfamily)